MIERPNPSTGLFQGYQNRHNPNWKYPPLIEWYKDSMYFYPPLNTFVNDRNLFVEDLQEWQKVNDSDAFIREAPVTVETKKNIFVQIGDKIKDVANDISGGFDWIKAKALFAPLVVFKPAMIRQLQKKGVKSSLSDSTTKTSILFYDTIIMGKNSLEYKKYNHADEDETGDDTNDYMKAILTNPNTVNVILQSIMQFFSLIKKKQESGQPLTENEKEIANQIDAIPVKDETKKDWGKMLGWVVGIVAAFFIAKKVFKF